MPGSNPRALEKARNLPADCLIMDLEDSVAPEAKEAARAQVAAAVSGHNYGNREVIVRVNGLDTAWAEEDLAMAAGCGADAVLLPKVESSTTVNEAIRLLVNAGAPADLPVWIMTETPRGVLDLDSIVADQPQLQAIVMGTSDLAKELRVDSGGERTGLLHSLGHSLLIARAQGIDIIDGVHLALDDPAGFFAACQQGRSLGFDGKSLIHPRQIEVANECFGISATEAAGAQEIVDAWRAARKRGDGITVLRGHLIEQLHVDEAERVLAIYSATMDATG